MEKNIMKWITSTMATLSVIGLIYLVGQMFTVSSFVFSWTLNFLLMAWFTFLASQIDFKLDSGYFESKKFEKEGKIYGYLGVHYYRRLLVWVGWEKITRQKNPVQKSISALKLVEYNSRSSEFGHTIIALIVLILTLAVPNSLNDAKWLIITNILLNIYPIMLQRFNRPRLLKIIHHHIMEEVLKND
ncbi:glycosyl-4,4'-diaponeurosporenoate acyltransferase CrtO family protein [Litoribacter populi]|uniref:glycosyl-4,4'-diaponeurosporenoate acyltransferase CrtO family protein n=1 Tax=Litoribacter populi TaxID=2598460 RepID=UPI001181374B|nr:hypothetical protein [Litoribacter populi]